MSGAIWITSYAALSFVVLLLTLGLIGVYRRIELQTGSRRQRWPFKHARPGDYVSFTPGSDRHTGFILLGTTETDSFAAAMSLAAVAKSWGYQLHLVIRRGRQDSWLDQMPNSMYARATELDAIAFDNLGILTTPVTAFLQEGRLVEAKSGLHFPSSISEAFQLVAGPLGNEKSWGPVQIETTL